MRAIRFATTALLCAVVAGCNKKDPVPTPPPPPPLTPQGLASSSWKAATPDLHDRLLIAHAIAKGKTEAIVMIATRIGATPAVAFEIAKLGGQIQARFDDVGYLSARLPLERLSEVTALPDVLMANLDGGGAGGLYAHDRDAVRYAVRFPRFDGSYSMETDTLLSARRGVGDAVPGESRSNLSAEIEALLGAAADPDLAVLAHSSRSGRFPEGGQDIFALVANRAVEFYGKPMFAPAGDEARVDSINGAASGRRVLAVASTETGASRGPASDGGAKPDLLEPSAVASALAELIAAARTENLPSDARHISWALRMSAERVEGYQAHEQGFGVVDVARAKELLARVKAQRFELPDILTRAPVKTYLSRFLPEPGVGQGLYEREGWLAKRPDPRRITLVRQNGLPTPLTYTLQWQGNDGTFKVRQEEVILPFDTPVEVEIEIAPAEVGIHSAHLYLIDKITQLPVHAVMTTVVASEQFTAANGYTIQHSQKAIAGQRPRRYFLEVPPNVSSLRVNVAARSGQVSMLLGMGGIADAGVNLPRAGKPIAVGKPQVAVVPYPPPGVYELTVLPAGSSPASVDVTASIHYVDSQLDAEPPRNNVTKLWMNNIYAPLQRSSVLAAVGARRMLDDIGGPTGMRAYNIMVPADSDSLRVAASPTDGRARMGLYLYDCSVGTCKLWGSDAFTKTTEKILIVPLPAPGPWRVVVDASAAGTAFTYAEIITNARFGTGSVAGEDEPRRTGARWNQQVSFQAHGRVPFGYDAVAVMDVIDAGGEAEEERAPYGDWQATGDARNEPLRPLRLTTQVFKLSGTN